MKYFKDIIGTTSVRSKEISRLTRNLDVSGFLEDEHVAEYNVIDGESPESISQKYYGTSDLWWLILKLNNIQDRFYDWPLSDSVLREWYNYLVAEGEIAAGTSAYNALRATNDAKRNITLLKTEYVEDFNYLVEKAVGA